MNIEDAKNLRPYDILHYTGPNHGNPNGNPCTRTIGPRGGINESIIHVRVNGAVKRWKRNPDRIQVPLKYGMYEFFYLTNDNLEHFHLHADCPLGEELS
jgi:hypothetical protein